MSNTWFVEGMNNYVLNSLGNYVFPNHKVELVDGGKLSQIWALLKHFLVSLWTEVSFILMPGIIFIYNVHFSESFWFFFSFQEACDHCRILGFLFDLFKQKKNLLFFLQKRPRWFLWMSQPLVVGELSLPLGVLCMPCVLRNNNLAETWTTCDRMFVKRKQLKPQKPYDPNPNKQLQWDSNCWTHQSEVKPFRCEICKVCPCWPEGKLHTVDDFQIPAALCSFRNDGKGERSCIRIGVFVKGGDEHGVFVRAQSAGSAAESGTVVVGVSHLDGDGSSGCFGGHVWGGNSC